MTTAILVTLALGLSYVCTKTTYWILKVFDGFLWWALAFWWVQNPISTDASIQTIVVVIMIGIGIACCFWAFWTNKTIKGQEVWGMKLPFSKSEDDDEVAPSRRDRINGYTDRVNNARNGIRRTRGG